MLKSHAIMTWVLNCLINLISSFFYSLLRTRTIFPRLSISFSFSWGSERTNLLLFPKGPKCIFMSCSVSSLSIWVQFEPKPAPLPSSNSSSYQPPHPFLSGISRKFHFLLELISFPPLTLEDLSLSGILRRNKSQWMGRAAMVAKARMRDRGRKV